MKQKRLFFPLAGCRTLRQPGPAWRRDRRHGRRPRHRTGPGAHRLHRRRAGQDDFTPATLAEVNGTWVDDYGAVLQINADAESYLYRTDEGRVGQGWVRDADGEAWLNFNPLPASL